MERVHYRSIGLLLWRTTLHSAILHDYNYMTINMFTIGRSGKSRLGMAYNQSTINVFSQL